MAKKRQEDVVAAYRASGLTQTEFCRQRNVAPSVLHYQLKRARAKERGTFVPVGRSSAGTIEIEVGSGTKIRVPLDAGAEVLARVLEAARASA